MEVYQVVVSFSEFGDRKMFYVVNTIAKKNKIQSAWGTELEARRVAKNLNFCHNLATIKESV